MECIVDGHHGIYVPQVWAERYGLAAAQSAGVSGLSVIALRAGPDHPRYWEAWDSVLNDYCHETKSETYYLYQDGDLYEVSQTEIGALGDEIW